MQNLLIIALSLFLGTISITSTVHAQENNMGTETVSEREQDLDKTLTITLYGNKYIVTTFILPGTNMIWNNVHPYIPDEILKLDNPTLTPEELKVRLYRMRKPTMNIYQSRMGELESKIASKYPQHNSPKLRVDLGEMLTSDRSNDLIELFPEFEEDIREADRINKEVSAFLFLNEIVDYNIDLLNNIKQKEAEKALEEQKSNNNETP